MKADRAILVGGGAFAREVYSWAYERSDITLPPCTSFLDLDTDAFSQHPTYGMACVGKPDDFLPSPTDVLILAIGDPAAKTHIFDMLIGKGGQFANVIHVTAVVSAMARLGAGIMIGPHAYISANSALGDAVGLNSMTGIGHDASVGKGCTISSQVDIMGNAALGDAVFVGSGARVLPGVQIGSNSRVGAGAVVVKSIKAGTTVYAQPAKVIR